MAPLLFGDAKDANLSCPSPSAAAAAICTSIDRKSTVRPSTIGRAIDRHSPRLRDLRRRAKTVVLNSMSRTKNSSWPSSAAQVPPELISPASSSRYLLTAAATDINDVDDVVDGAASSVNVFQDSESAPPPTPAIEVDQHAVCKKQEQVVALRVSLHCKCCEAKVRKHISRMEGVRSFEIDLTTKKVTVIGEVTPLEVLNSVSKVKNAQFWPSPPRR